MDAAQQPAPATPVTSVLTRDDDHKYWLSELHKPIENLIGVTEVMTELGFEDDTYYTEEHSSRGHAVHAELASIALGRPEFPFFDPDLCGWRASGVGFLDQLRRDGAIILGVEKMAWHRLYRFAGTIDLWVLWNGYEWILDWKTGKAPKIARFKLAAYDTLLWPTKLGLPRKRAAIELDRDGGRARLVEYNKTEHFHDGNRFLSYLNTARDLRQYAPKKD